MNVDVFVLADLDPVGFGTRVLISLQWVVVSMSLPF